MKKIGHFLKNVKATCNLIFPNGLVVLGKWGARSQFHIWTNFTNHFSIMFDLNIFLDYKFTNLKKSPDKSIELQKYMFLSLIVIIKTLKGRFMFSFHIDPDLKMLFEKLATQIGARPALGTKLRFEAAFGDLRVDINKVQRLTLGQ